MTKDQLYTPNPHPLITDKGDINREAWDAFEREVNGRSQKECQFAFQEAIILIPEPPVATKTGGPSKRWISWYQAIKQCRRQVAAVTCKKIISGELKEYDVKPVPSTF